MLLFEGMDRYCHSKNTHQKFQNTHQILNILTKLLQIMLKKHLSIS